MHQISKHHTEEKWKRYTGKYCWVDLFVTWNSVSVNNLLENGGEFIGLEVSWLSQAINILWAFLYIQSSEVFLINYWLYLGKEIVCFRCPNETAKKRPFLLQHV